MECFGSLDVVFHCKDDVRVTLENVAVLPGLAFDLMYFNCIQEKHGILMNRDGTWILNGRVHFVKFLDGNYIQATRVEHGTGPPAMMAAMMRPEQQRSISRDGLHISPGHTNDANAIETTNNVDQGDRYPGILRRLWRGEGDLVRRSQIDEAQVVEVTAADLHRSYGVVPAVHRRRAVLYDGGGCQHQRRIATISAGQERSYLVPRLSRLAQRRQTRGGNLWRFGHCSF